jgi:hypothetical protein
MAEEPAAAVQTSGSSLPVGSARGSGALAGTSQQEADLFGESDGEQDASCEPQQASRSPGQGPSSTAGPIRGGPGRPRKQPAVQQAAAAAVACAAPPGALLAATASAGGQQVGSAGPQASPCATPAGPAAATAPMGGTQAGNVGAAGEGERLVAAKRLTTSDLKQGLVTLPTAAGGLLGVPLGWACHPCGGAKHSCQDLRVADFVWEAAGH